MYVCDERTERCGCRPPAILGLSKFKVQCGNITKKGLKYVVDILKHSVIC